MEMNLKEFFGTVIKQIRKEKKVSQVELAVLCDMERGYISKLERALIQPSLSTIYKVADALNVEASHVLDRISLLRLLHETPNRTVKNLKIEFDVVDDHTWRNVVIYLNRIFDQWKPIKADKQKKDRNLFQLSIDSIQRLDLYHNMLSVFRLNTDNYHVVLKGGKNQREILNIKDVDDNDIAFRKFHFVISKA